MLALLWVAVAPIAAWAADYRCTEVDLVAQVQTDGSVSVVDQRIFEFDGAERETLKWLYEGFPEDAALVVERVRMAPANAEGAVDGEWVDLSEATFQLSWRSGGGPESDAWAYDRFQHRLYAFVGHLPSRVVFEVAYRVEGAVVAYDDAADFQWLYVPRDYAVALDNVTAEVVLPLAADDTVRAEDNVYAWGHGPADGSVSIALDGSITFTDPEVEPTQFAEARVLFPVDWLTNLSDEARLANQGNPQYSWTPRYEAEWVDRDTYRTIIRLRLIIGLLGLAAVVLVGALLVYRRWGRERPPAFTDDYGDEVPDARLAPAVMGRLWRWNHESPDDVVATVLDMVRRGALRLRMDNNGRPEALEIPQQGSISDEALDGATLALLNTLSEDAESISLRELSAAAHERPLDLLRAVQEWQRKLTDLVQPHHFFDSRSRVAQRWLLVAAGLLALVALDRKSVV